VLKETVINTMEMEVKKLMESGYDQDQKSCENSINLFSSPMSLDDCGKALSNSV